MVIDSSAFVAILLGEAEQTIFIAAITADPTRLASAPTVLETSMVLLGRRGEAGVAAFRSFYTQAAVEPLLSTRLTLSWLWMLSHGSVKVGMRQD